MDVSMVTQASGLFYTATARAEPHSTHTDSPLGAVFPMEWLPASVGLWWPRGLQQGPVPGSLLSPIFSPTGSTSATSPIWTSKIGNFLNSDSTYQVESSTSNFRSQVTVIAQVYKNCIKLPSGYVYKVHMKLQISVMLDLGPTPKMYHHIYANITKSEKRNPKS